MKKKKRKKYVNQYFGITHQAIYSYKRWRKKMCPQNIHMFDEVLSPSNDEPHCLVCDACQLIVNIKNIDTTYVKAPIGPMKNFGLSNETQASKESPIERHRRD